MKRNNSVIERDRQSSKKCRLKFSSLTSLSYFGQDLKDVSEQSKRKINASDNKCCQNLDLRNVDRKERVLKYHFELYRATK